MRGARNVKYSSAFHFCRKICMQSREPRSVQSQTTRHASAFDPRNVINNAGLSKNKLLFYEDADNH